MDQHTPLSMENDEAEPVEEAMEEPTDAAGDDTVMGGAASLLRGIQTDEDETEQLQVVEQTIEQAIMGPIAEMAADGNMGSSVLQQLILRELASSQVSGAPWAQPRCSAHAHRHVE